MESTGIEGTSVPQISQSLLRRGLRADILTLNPWIFTTRDLNLNQSEIRERFMDMAGERNWMRHKKTLKECLDFMDAGGTVTPLIPTPQMIEAELHRGRPMIANPTTGVLGGFRPQFNSHFVVVVGITDRNITVLDPTMGFGNERCTYSLNDFMYALHANAHGEVDNSSLIRIRSDAKENHSPSS